MFLLNERLKVIEKDCEMQLAIKQHEVVMLNELLLTYRNVEKKAAFMVEMPLNTLA